MYQTGDKVYFKRNDAKEWHGPAKVLGCEKSQYLLKHGGSYVRVHPSKMQMVHGSDSTGLPGKVLLPTHAHKTCQTDSGNVCVQSGNASTEHDNVSDDPSAVVNDASANVSDNVVMNDASANVSDNVVVNDASDNEYDDDDDYDLENVLDHLDVPLTPPATPAHGPLEQPPQQHNMDIQPQAADIQVNQIDIDNDNEECGSLCVDNPESVRVSHALSRLYDFNKPGNKDMTSFPGRRHTKAHTLDDIEEEEEQEVEEVYFGSATNHARYHQAKLEELQKWQEFKTYEEIPDTGQPRVSCKWVCTEKMKAGVLMTKARLVARGFEEDKSQLRTDSPTCYKDSLRILLSVLSARNWKLKSINIKSAYLQGNETQREIYLKPPKEANTVNLWKLIRTPYGLVDAGRQWYIRVQKEFASLGGKQVKCDRAVCVWKNPSGSGPCGIILSHVDDFLYGGNSYFLKTIIPQIRQRFKIGSEEDEKFKYLGLVVSQVSSGIQLSLENYISSIKEMDTSRLGKDKTRPLDSDERSEFKHLVGQINWVATQCRPHVAYENCLLGSQADKSTVAEVYLANKVVRKIQEQSLNLIFPKDLDLKTLRIVSFCDAAFANLHDKGSQGGYMIFHG